MITSLFCIFRVILVYIFFFKQKTAYGMRIRDWSSDVCSSDLSDDASGGSEPTAARGPVSLTVGNGSVGALHVEGDDDIGQVSRGLDADLPLEQVESGFGGPEGESSPEVTSDGASSPDTEHDVSASEQDTDDTPADGNDGEEVLEELAEDVGESAAAETPSAESGSSGSGPDVLVSNQGTMDAAIQQYLSYEAGEPLAYDQSVPGGISRTEESARAGRFAGQALLLPGDPQFRDSLGHRSEWQSNVRARAGIEYAYGLSYYFPTDWNQGENGSFDDRL